MRGKTVETYPHFFDRMIFCPVPIPGLSPDSEHDMDLEAEAKHALFSENPEGFTANKWDGVSDSRSGLIIADFWLLSLLRAVLRRGTVITISDNFFAAHFYLSLIPGLFHLDGQVLACPGFFEPVDSPSDQLENHVLEIVGSDSESGLKMGDYIVGRLRFSDVSTRYWCSEKSNDEVSI